MKKLTMRAQMLRFWKRKKWLTIPEIRARLDHYAMETTISARLRDFRKPQHGRHSVPKRLRRGTKLYEYALD